MALGLYRIWIARCADWQPRHWAEVPPRILPLEAADEGCYSAVEAIAFLEGFNSEMLRDPKGCWAVALPVQVPYPGVGGFHGDCQLPQRSMYSA